MNPLLKERVWLIGRPAYHHITQFALPVNSDSLRILDVAAGVSDFMSVWRNGLAVDPCYGEDYNDLYTSASHDLFLFAANQIQNDRNATNEQIRLYDMHRQALTGFLIDFGNRSGSIRYRADSLPDLPLVCGSFDLAICSHFLFLYPHDNEFAVDSIRRVMELTDEFRIWPLPTPEVLVYLKGRLPDFLFTSTAKYLSITK